MAQSSLNAKCTTCGRLMFNTSKHFHACYVCLNNGARGLIPGWLTYGDMVAALKPELPVAKAATRVCREVRKDNYGRTTHRLMSTGYTIAGQEGIFYRSCDRVPKRYLVEVVAIPGLDPGPNVLASYGGKIGLFRLVEDE